MPVLALNQRPVVAFDPTNPLHRRDYYNFVQSNSWSSCSVTYVSVMSPGTENTLAAIQLELANYYSHLEFANGSGL